MIHVRLVFLARSLRNLSETITSSLEEAESESDLGLTGKVEGSPKERSQGVEPNKRANAPSGSCPARETQLGSSHDGHHSHTHLPVIIEHSRKKS